MTTEDEGIRRKIIQILLEFRDENIIVFDVADRIMNIINRHTHIAGDDNIDTCKECGHDLRHPVHYPLDYQ